nr:replication factor A protein 1-like [Ipomoea batatas]
MESTSVGNLVKECSLLSLDVEDNGGLDFDIEIENAAGYVEETRSGNSGMGQSEEGGLHGAAQSGMDSGKHKESKEYAEWEGMHGDIQEKVNKELGKGKGVMGSSESSTAADQIEDMQEDGLVSPIHTRRAIRVRLVRSYEVPALRGQAISKSKECLFHDEEVSLMLVVEIHSPVEKLIAGKPSRLMDFLIQDNEERQLKCTIWDDHVDAMLPYFNSTEPEPVIVLIQLCRAKTVNGEVRITSSYDATKLWFNHYCPEFTEFKAKLTKENTPMKSISTNSMVSQTTDIRDFISGSVVITTISDLYQQTEEVVDVPTELESLIGKSMVFKVNIKKDYKQNYGSAFGVMKILNDENIVAAYCSSFGVDQEKDLISKMLEDYGNEYSEDPKQYYQAKTARSRAGNEPFEQKIPIGPILFNPADEERKT